MGSLSSTYGLTVTQAPAQSDHTRARLVRYTDYQAFYRGDQWDTLPAPGERRLTFNYARVFVNKAASYLLSKPVGYDALPVGESGSKRKQAGARAVEQWLGEVADFNHLAALDLDTAISAGTLGDGAWTVRWDPVADQPRLTTVDPGPGKIMRWSVPESKGHDDLLISAALVGALDDRDWRPRVAVGRQREDC
jgi:hypothetical protein